MATMNARLDPRRQGDTFRPDLIRWVLTDDDFSELLLAIEHSSEVVVDLETTGLDEYATFGGATNGGYPARIVLASFTLPREDEEGEEPTTWVLPLSHPDSPWLGSWRRTLGRVAEQIAASARPVVNANVKFDAKWIYAHTGVDLSALIVWDTQVSSHLLDETESTRLKERVPATFGVQRWDDFDLSKPGAAERVPMFDLGVYACIAEGSSVLTSRGLVPIEQIKITDRLWDGVEWVSHDGVIFKGTQPVVTLDNLTGTPDHLVLTTEDDYVCLGSLISGEAGTRRPAVGSDGWTPRPVPHPDGEDSRESSASSRGGDVLEVPARELEASERPATWQGGVPVPVGGEVRPRSPGTGAERSLPRDGAALYPRDSDLSISRRSGNSDALHLGGTLHPVGAGESVSRGLPRYHVRSDRLGRSLRAGKPSTGHLPGAGNEHEPYRSCAVHGSAGCPTSSVASRQDGSARFSAESGWPGSAAATRNDRGAGGQSTLPTARVYDILNAGPRHRFAVSGLIVSNCRDTYWTWRLYELHIWLMNISEPEEPDDPDALELARVGGLATHVAMPTVRSLTAIEQRGMLLDTAWVREHLAECQDTSRALTDKLATRYGMDPATASFAPTSKWFLAWTECALAAGDLVIGGLTATGRAQWDKAVLVRQSRAGRDVATDLLELRSAVKQAEYLTSWLGQVTPAGEIHATYHAGRVVTGRLSCVTSDTLIDMPRDMVKYPDGVPITEVRVGDWVYAFDHHRELTLRQVEWVGQTGVKSTVVVTVRNSHGHERQVRCTPEHLVRLRSGDYRHAERLQPGDVVMPMVRRGYDHGERGGYLTFFPHSVNRGNGQRGGGRNKEHRWVAEHVYGQRLSTKTDVHHLNGTMLDNTPSNLRPLSMAEHRSYGHQHPRRGQERERPTLYLGPNDYRVVSVETGEIEPVWDMTVPQDHCFVANGIVVHNSSDPNMQQVTKSLKPAFVPRPGNVIAELDFSQIELRVAAFISRCEPMLEAFRQGHDLHRLLGAKLTGKAPEDVTPEERQAAKSANFGLLYQMSAGGFQTYAETVYGVTFTADEAAAVRQAFYDTWDGIGAWHLRSIKKARMTGQIVSPIGRVRRLPDINSYNDRLVGWSERSAVNSPVQGFASDLMQLSAAWIGGFVPEHAPVPDAEIVATVHDSIVIEAPADRWEPIVRQCMDRMVRVGELLTGLDCTLDVPLAVEAHVGSRWGLADIGTVES